MELRFEKDRNGKEFFDLTAGRSYCDDKYCPTCESGESHFWDDLEELGVQDMTYTAPDGSVWYGQEYMSDGSGYFGWSESRYRFWKQDFQADDLKKVRRRIEDALRKTATPNQMARIADILGIKTR